ncbi:hypothetical protein [Aidingimonas lacisalsi]|nr:hypothetical protein [Aidingimonas lacisalsi]
MNEKLVFRRLIWAVSDPKDGPLDCQSGRSSSNVEEPVFGK